MPTRFSGSALEIKTVLSGSLERRSARSLDRLRQRELLSHEAVDEAAAANLAPRFQAPVYGQQTSPRRRIGFTREQIAKHDAVAAQKLPRPTLDHLFAFDRYDVCTPRAIVTSVPPASFFPPRGRR